MLLIALKYAPYTFNTPYLISFELSEPLDAFKAEC